MNITFKKNILQNKYLILFIAVLGILFGMFIWSRVNVFSGEIQNIQDTKKVENILSEENIEVSLASSWPDLASSVKALDQNFENFITWPSSDKFEDNMGIVLKNLHRTATSPYYTFVDMNGDGLTDVLIHGLESTVLSGPNRSTYQVLIYGIYQNTGGNDLDLVYKCVVGNTGIVWGDCAVKK